MDIVFENVFYSYPGSGRDALKNINIEIKSGTMTAVLGESGSGKSTFLRLFNALIAPTEGRVLLEGEDINGEKYDRKRLREKVGLVFQYPERQLFESTLIKDVAFGPLKRGRSKEEALRDAEEALTLLEIPEDKWTGSPMALSGGEKRKAALAGILALQGDVIVLDEISSGLDAKSSSSIFSILKGLGKEGKTIVFSSHDPEEAALYAGRVILIENGEVRVDGTLNDVYSYKREYMTEGAKLKEMLEKSNVKTGKMDSIYDSLFSLSSLLHTV